MADNGSGKLTYTISEAATLLGIGRNTAYDPVKRGEVPVVRVGSKDAGTCAPAATAPRRATHQPVPEPETERAYVVVIQRVDPRTVLERLQ